MPPWKPHVVRIKAFAFEIVWPIVDRRLPKAFLRIPPPQRKRVVATFALELSGVSTEAIVAGRQAQWDSTRATALLSKHGGRAYHAAVYSEARLASRWRDLINEQHELEKIARHCFDSSNEHVPRVKFGIGPGGSRVRWRYDLVSSSEINHYRAKMTSLSQALTRVNWRLVRAREKVAGLGNIIKKSAPFVMEWQTLRWKRFMLDFSSAIDAFSTGAAFLIRNTDAEWWEYFVAEFQRRATRRTASRELALRDSEMCALIHGINARDWNKSAASMLQAPNVWMADSPSVEAIKTTRARMRRADREALRWLARHGCRENFYTRWLAQLREDPRMALHLDAGYVARVLKCFGPIARKARSGRDGDDEILRLNEVSWCLAVGTSKAQLFLPLVSVRVGATAWERHRTTWWTKVEAAMARGR